MSLGRIYTYADLEAMPVDNRRREIIDGELIVSPSPTRRHQDVLAELGYVFMTYLKAHGGGKIYQSPMDVVLSDTNVPQPDLLFLTDEQLAGMSMKNVQGPPALAVEVVSDSRMDRVRKRDLYARFRIPEYWIFDPEADRVEVYRLDGETYTRPVLLEPGDTLTYNLLPGLEIDLAQIFVR